MDSSNSTAYTVEPKNTATVLTNQQIVQKKPPETSHNNAAGQDLSAAALRRVGRSRGGRRRTHVRKISKDVVSSGGGEELTDEKAEVEKKIVALQKIVPGGEKLAVEKLFEETAEYILALECQVKALRFLTAFVQSSEKKKRKLGG